MKNNLIFCLLVTLLAFNACAPINDKNPAVFGNWMGARWLISNKPSDLNAALVSFSFSEDGTYTARFGEQIESGVWRSDKDKLFTTAAGAQEKVVRIIVADGTHLHFEMNRMGQQETLELVKQL
jgi:hypothetical protein